MNCPTCNSRIGFVQLASPLSGIRCSHCGEKCSRVLSPTRIIGVFAALWVLIAAIRFGGRQLGEPVYVWSLALIFGALAFAIVTTAPLTRDAGSTGWTYVRRLIVPWGLLILTLSGLKILRATW